MEDGEGGTTPCPTHAWSGGGDKTYNIKKSQNFPLVRGEGGKLWNLAAPFTLTHSHTHTHTHKHTDTHTHINLSFNLFQTTVISFGLPFVYLSLTYNLSDAAGIFHGLRIHKKSSYVTFLSMYTERNLLHYKRTSKEYFRRRLGVL